MWNAVTTGVSLAVLAVVTPESGVDFWIPVAFLVSGALLLLWELSMPGFFIAVAAIPLLILGVIGLAIEGFFTAGPIWPLLIGLLVVGPTVMITLRIYRRLGPPDAAPTTMSADTMRGQLGTVTVPVDSETTRGKIRLQGTIWSAKSESGSISEGTRVRVKEVRGVHVLVEPVDPQETDPPAASATPGAGESATVGQQGGGL